MKNQPPPTRLVFVCVVVANDLEKCNQSELQSVFFAFEKPTTKLKESKQMLFVYVHIKSFLLCVQMYYSSHYSWQIVFYLAVNLMDHSKNIKDRSQILFIFFPDFLSGCFLFLFQTFAARTHTFHFVIEVLVKFLPCFQIKTFVYDVGNGCNVSKQRSPMEHARVFFLLIRLPSMQTFQLN